MKLPDNSVGFSASKLQTWREKQAAKLADSPRIFHIVLCDGWTQKELMKLPEVSRNRIYFWNSINQDDFSNLRRVIAQCVEQKKLPASDEREFFVWKTAVSTIDGNWHYFSEISSRIRSELEKRGTTLTEETEKQIEEMSEAWRREIKLKEKKAREKKLSESEKARMQREAKLAAMRQQMFDKNLNRVESKIQNEMREMKAWTRALEACAQGITALTQEESFGLDKEIMLY